MQVDIILDGTLDRSASSPTLPPRKADLEAEQEAAMLEIGAALFGAVMAENRVLAEETRTALQAVRAALDSARRLRYARSSDERQQLAEEAQRQQAAQAEALRHWHQNHRLVLETPMQSPSVSPRKQMALGS
jgi:hypothetical protein